AAMPIRFPRRVSARSRVRSFGRPCTRRRCPCTADSPGRLSVLRWTGLAVCAPWANAARAAVGALSPYAVAWRRRLLKIGAGFGDGRFLSARATETAGKFPSGTRIARRTPVARLRGGDAPAKAVVGVRAKERLDLVRGHRHADVVALDLIAAELLQEMHLLVVLDALGDHFQAEGVRERDDHRDDVARIAGVAHAHDEAAVDLQDVDRQARQVAERAVAGAEVVHRHLDAGAAQRLQLARAFLDVVNQHAF